MGISKAALRLGVTAKAVDRLARTGRLPFVMGKDKRRRFHIDEIDRLCEAEQARRSQWLTCYDVAALLGISSKTAVRWAKSGRLPTVIEDGGRYRYKFSAAEIQAHLPGRIQGG